MFLLSQGHLDALKVMEFYNLFNSRWQERDFY